MVSLVLMLGAAAAGLAVGRARGGDTDLLRVGSSNAWYPDLPVFAAAGLVGMLLGNLLDLDGGVGAVIAIASTTSLLWFCLVNVRVGGMVLAVGGLALNAAVLIFNGGMPRSTNLGAATRGARVDSDGAFLGFLGEVIPGPFGAAWSFGDLLILSAIGLVTMSLSLHRVVAPRGGYSAMLSALGEGPAPRRGPGMHPTRRSELFTSREPDESLVRLLRDDDPYS